MPTREQRLVQTGEYYKQLAMEAADLLVAAHPIAVRNRVVQGFVHCLTNDVLRIAILDNNILDEIRQIMQDELTAREEEASRGNPSV